MEFDRREVKLKEVVWLWGLPAILTKEKGFGLQGMINCEEATRKYMGELMEEKGCVSKVCLCKLSVLTFHLQW